MRTFHRTNAARFLCVTILPLFAFSCVSLTAEEPPWAGCRAASKTEYESAKRDFLLQTSVGAYAMTGHLGADAASAEQKKNGVTMTATDKAFRSAIRSSPQS